MVLLFKLFIIVLFILLSVTILFLRVTKNRQQMSKTYSISAFLGASSDDEIQEPKQSLIGKINDYFGDSVVEDTNDGDEDGDGGGDDGGE